MVWITNYTMRMSKEGACYGKLRGLKSLRAKNFIASSCFLFILFTWGVPLHTWAQSPVTHSYSASLIRAEGFNPLKPMFADLLEWLPEADVTLEREADVLHIITEREITPVELRAHLEPHGVLLGSFLKDGKPMNTTTLGAEALPWLMDLKLGTELSSEEVAARKAAWVGANPIAYERILHSANGNPDQQ